MEKAQNSFLKKIKNAFVRLWKYFNTFEKCWLFVMIAVCATLAVLFPQQTGWLRICEGAMFLGGCVWQLLVAKRTKWAFVVALIFYQLAKSIIYLFNGLYISAALNLLFWIPILVISFVYWGRLSGSKNQTAQTPVKEVAFKKDILIFFIVLGVSVGVACALSAVEILAERMSDYWYLDVLLSTFSVCNGLFLLFAYKEQWFFAYAVCILQAVIWLLNGSYIMLVLTALFLVNITYGLLSWKKYIKTNPREEPQNNEAKPPKIKLPFAYISILITLFIAIIFIAIGGASGF